MTNNEVIIMVTKKETYIEGMEGCNDHDCLFKLNSGMGANGGCSCEKELRRMPHGLKAIRTIRFLRDKLLTGAYIDK